MKKQQIKGKFGGSRVIKYEEEKYRLFFSFFSNPNALLQRHIHPSSLFNDKTIIPFQAHDKKYEKPQTKVRIW